MATPTPRPRKAPSKSAAAQPQKTQFHGFPEEGFRFLRQLKQHNDRDWFRERKPDYDRFVEQPMKELVLAVADGCRSRGLPLYAKDKSPVMRVYRDIRFSKDKRPFKTHVAAELRSSFTGSHCMLYIHLSPEESLLAAGVWQPDRPLLHAWREVISKEPKRFEKMNAALAKGGLGLSKNHSLSMLPRGFQTYSEESFGPWLKLTSFVLSKPLQKSDCTSTRFSQTVVDFALAAKPLFEFAWFVEETRPIGRDEFSRVLS